MIINATTATVIGRVTRSGRPAITSASMKNIFCILCGVIPTDAYLANSLLLWRRNPSVLENTLAMPMAASSTQNAPKITIMPCLTASSVIFSCTRFSTVTAPLCLVACKISFCNTFSSDSVAPSVPSIRIYVSASAPPICSPICSHGESGRICTSA